MADSIVKQLVSLVLDSGCTPEDACRDSPDLLTEVREQLRRIRSIDAELDGLFPKKESALPDEVTPSHGVEDLPHVPGHEVLSVLGHGGMGVVYKARHLRLNRTVAVKMLLGGAHADLASLKRLLREAEAVAALRHPNIVQVHEVGDHDGLPYFTMELVEGGSLREKLAGNVLDAREAASLVATLADAMEVAHASGIVHRDLKPANVLLTAEGVPKIVDFGLARRMSGGDDLTVVGAILGTPSYMAPEQIRGLPVGSAADVYALGAILYEVLTGRPPFHSDSPLATQLEVLSKDPVRPSLLCSRIPRDLETISLRCLHKDPARRYESAAELASDLRRFLAHEPIRARPVGRLERGLLWGKRHPAGVSVMVFGAVLLCFFVGRAVQNQALAAETRAEEAVWSPRVDDVFERLRSGDFVQARSLLDQVPVTLSETLRQRVGQARRELSLVEQLDGIRLQRVDITEGRFDRSENRRVADLAYEQAFRSAGFGVVGDDAGFAVARVQAAAVRLALVGALDDWAFCAGNGPRGAWLLEVARRSDHDPSAWRERLRDPSLRLDEQTLAELESDLRANRMTVQLLVGAAERLREAGIDVVPLLTVVQRAHPGDFWANFALGDVLWMQDKREAIRYAQAAVAIRPRSSIAHQALGTALRKTGRLEDALESYRQAVLVEPDFAEAHGRLGLVLQGAKKVDEAIVEYREALRINPELAWVHHNLGTALFDTGRPEEALEEYRETLQREPRSGMAHDGLIHCLQRLGRTREALGALQRAVEVEPIPPRLHSLGNCLVSLNEFEAAEAAYRRALELDPAHESSKSALRTLLVSIGRGEEALVLFRAAIQASPADPLAWDGFPELCAYLGRRDDYRAACEALLERFGDTEEPRDCERIGRACLLLPLEPALPGAALIERAIASDPSRRPLWILPFFGVAKALAEYRSARFESALELLRGQAGLVLKPLPELIRAMALQRTGADAEARRNLAAAALSTDWTPAAAGSHDSWIAHVLRREAEALILPELADLLAGRQQPRDDDTRAAMIGACVFEQRHAAAARLYESVLGEGAAVTDREQRHRVARTLARAGAGLGVDAAEAAERARFRALARVWLRADLASCRDLEVGGREQRTQASATLNAWLDDPAFAVLRDPEAMEQVPPAERDDCRALWLEVETVVRRLEARH